MLTYNILNKVAGRWVPSPDSAKYIVYVVKNSRPNFTRAQDGYFLFVYVKIAIMSKAVVSIICNSSYVLIIIPLSVRLKSDESTSPSYPIQFWCLRIAPCFTLSQSTPNIRISWDYHPTFKLILGQVPRSFIHLWASSYGFRPFAPGIV